MCWLKKYLVFCLFELRLYGQVNPLGSYQVQPVYLITFFLGFSVIYIALDKRGYQENILVEKVPYLEL